MFSFTFLCKCSCICNFAIFVQIFMKFSPKCRTKKLGIIYTILGSFCSFLNWKGPKIRPRKISVVNDNVCCLSFSVIGTSSLRRAAQLQRRFPTYKFENIVSFVLINNSWHSSCPDLFYNPYFREDWLWNNFYGHSPPFHWIIQEGLLSVTSESMCTKYWLTACSSLPRKKVWLGELTVLPWP